MEEDNVHPKQMPKIRHSDICIIKFLNSSGTCAEPLFVELAVNKLYMQSAMEPLFNYIGYLPDLLPDKSI